MDSELACNPDETRGRLHPEAESSHRTAFQRDRDRIIHCTAFRRLKHKTQVFVAHEGDHFRTRLTHTIEVAQVARTIAKTLRLNSELTEAIALAHDLGHTPFGHVGEDVLAEKMARFGGFDHNGQALKIVTSLERHYAEFGEADIAHLPIVGECFAKVDAKYPNLDPTRRRHEALRRVFGMMVEDVLATSTTLINGSGAQSAQDIRNLNAPVIRFSDGMFEQLSEIRAFLFENMYRSDHVTNMRLRSKEVVAGLFDIFLADPNTMPDPWNVAGEDDTRAALISDYLSGMTDGYADRRYTELTSGS